MIKKVLCVGLGTVLVTFGGMGSTPAHARDRHHHPYHHGHHVGEYFGYAALGSSLAFLMYNAGRQSSNAVYQRGYYDGQRSSYYQPTPPQIIVVPPPTPPSSAGSFNSAPYATGSLNPSQCRETRPYETTIYIDGQPQYASGTACLTYSGSWVVGPMTLGR